MNIREALSCREIFGSAIRDPGTYQAWFAFLSALFGLPMSDSEAEIFRACTGRKSIPQSAFTEAWMICGRRGGKSLIMALCAVFLATFRSYTPYLAPGEIATIMVLAADRKQARTILRYTRGLLSQPIFRKLLIRETQESFDLSNSVTIEIHTANIASVRGYTLAACLADEIAFWSTSQDSAAPDVEILAGIRPAMSTIPGAMLICASSPYARRGALWEAFRRHHGKDDAPVLVWQAPTRLMNPTVPQSVIDEAMELDPSSAAAEYGAQFRRDIESFISREVVDACVIPDRFELPPTHGVRYHAFVDPSGGSADDMTLCIGHRERETIIVDCIRAVRPPFSPEAVVADFAQTLKSYGVHRVTGDRYGGEWPREAFRKVGVTYECSETSKRDLYREMLPLLNGGRVELLDHQKLTAQLCALERRTARGGRDSIDHPPGQHDDVANCVAGLTVAVSKRGGMMRISDSLLAKSRMPARPIPVSVT